jgi:transitional endoplasmic reticulum ATPase
MEVLVIIACNNIDTIDEALLRQGRLGDHIHIGYPDTSDKLEILKVCIFQQQQRRQNNKHFIEKDDKDKEEELYYKEKLKDILIDENNNKFTAADITGRFRKLTLEKLRRDILLLQ